MYFDNKNITSRSSGPTNKQVGPWQGASLTGGMENIEAKLIESFMQHDLLQRIKLGSWECFEQQNKTY